MKKVIILFTILVIFLALSYSLTKAIDSDNSYTINEFSSQVEIEKDTSLNVTENIQVNFTYPKHGIFRIIPVVYSANAKTIKAKLEVLTINDENGNKIKYEKSRLGQSMQFH